MIGKLLYMIPFFGMFTGSYYVYTMDMAAAYVMAGLALIQSLICLLYIIYQMSLAGVDGTLEVEVQLWDALMPVIFLTLSSISFLLITNETLRGFA